MAIKYERPVKPEQTAPLEPTAKPEPPPQPKTASPPSPAALAGLSGWVQRYRKAILLLVVVLCLGGFSASRSLPVAIFPDLAAPRIIVTADAGNTPIPTVLANITRPLENAVAGVPNVTRVGSLTQRGGDEAGRKL